MTTNATGIEEAREVLWIAERLAESAQDPRDAKMYRAAASAIQASAAYHELEQLRAPPQRTPDLDAKRLRAWFAARPRGSVPHLQVADALGAYVASRSTLESGRQLALFGFR